MRVADAENPRAKGILLVQSAVHGDIRLPLRAGVTSIGRALSTDLVLGDPSLAGTHVRLHVAEAITLEAVEQPLLLAGSDLLPAGQTRLLTQATAFKAGDVSMRLDIVASPVPAAAGSPPLWRRVAAGVVLLAFAGSAAFAFASSAPSHAPAPTPALAMEKLQAAAAPDLAAVRAELDQRHLGPVQVEALPDGSYRASGTLAPQEMPAWREMARWFDEAAAGRIVLIDKVAFASAAAPLAIQSAWLGARPYVIDGAGEKLFVGAVLANGWAIEGIEPGRVLMRRQGQHVAVTF